MMASPTPISEFTRDVGDGFRPTEVQLVNHYLKLKISGYDHLVCRIPELNIYKLDPWDLTEHSGLNSNEEEWYFFHRNGGKASRTTPNGSWINTCKKRKVIHAEEEIGTKNTFVFRNGRGSKGARTGWIIYEYSGSFNLPNQEAFVICKLLQKRTVPKKKKQKGKGKGITPTPACNEGEPKSNNSTFSDLEHQDLYPKSNNSTFSDLGHLDLYPKSNNSTFSDLEHQDLYPKSNNSTFSDVEHQDLYPKSNNSTFSDLAHQDLYPKSNNSTFSEGETSQLMTCEKLVTEEVDPQPLPYSGFFSGYNDQNYSPEPVIGSHMNTEQDLSFGDLWDFS